MVENTVALNSSINIFLLLFKFNYQSCLSQLASGNFNWKISVTMLKLGYIFNFGLISQYLTFTSDPVFWLRFLWKAHLLEVQYAPFTLIWQNFFLLLKNSLWFHWTISPAAKSILAQKQITSRSDAFFSHGDQPFPATKITNSILLIK